MIDKKNGIKFDVIDKISPTIERIRVKQTLEQIRKDFSDRVIFNFCAGNAAAHVRITEIHFDIESKELNYTVVLPSCPREIKVDAQFSTE